MPSSTNVSLSLLSILSNPDLYVNLIAIALRQYDRLEIYGLSRNPSTRDYLNADTANYAP